MLTRVADDEFAPRISAGRRARGGRVRKADFTA